MERPRGFRLRMNPVSVFRRFVGRRGSSEVWCGVGRRVLAVVKRDVRLIRVGQEPPGPEKASVPAGHLAVYVGEAEGATCRVVVPVFYFNHPLFANLLREAETVYGFDHPGGIQIPCRISEFENVKSRIAADGDARRVRRSWSF
ncbi:PREDICTED: auxin-induced protein 15A-like [Ipomoea nil]|uniref:auxin-induced protein 15A-like n=1 Tax=Ipomoea nil TaxID=35883 RepID=UPI0009014393|nr:PREDICTED: auxin-induced protein 15A-like [Ipomoea nil]